MGATERRWGPYGTTFARSPASFSALIMRHLSPNGPETPSDSDLSPVGGGHGGMGDGRLNIGARRRQRHNRILGRDHAVQGGKATQSFAKVTPSGCSAAPYQASGGGTEQAWWTVEARKSAGGHAGLARLWWRAFSSLPVPSARVRWGSGSRAMNVSGRGYGPRRCIWRQRFRPAGVSAMRLARSAPP